MNLSLPLFDFPDDALPLTPAQPSLLTPAGGTSRGALGLGRLAPAQPAQPDQPDQPDQPHPAQPAQPAQPDQPHPAHPAQPDQPDAIARAAASAAPAGHAAQAGNLAQLTRLHPGLWRASQFGGAPRRTTASGFAALDAQLPGGGWPHGVLTELLLPQAGVGELRLLAPALAAVAPAVALAGAGGPRAAGDGGRCVMLFDPPAALSAWGLLQCGLDPRHWLVVRARAGQGRVGPAQAQAGLGPDRPARGGRLHRRPQRRPATPRAAPTV